MVNLKRTYIYIYIYIYIYKIAIDKVKHEIIILKNRSSEFKEQYEAIDTKILMKIREETADHATIENLKKFWVEDYEKEEERSLAIWN